MGGGASSGAKRKAPKERAPEGVVPSKPRHADEYLRQVQADRKAKRSTKGRATCSTCSTGCTSRLTNQSLTSERSQRSVRSKGTSGTPKSVRFAGQMEDVLDARTAQWPVELPSGTVFVEGQAIYATWALVVTCKTSG
ncbi:unnamed protein product [Durusdinium trenchii]|uniref:Uncharacterized protein n=1 Tax=Durusdinium trenchii TaxID=1381693 RepID=A0ABP0P8K6_9DINO